jgi:hypothetical protein
MSITLRDLWISLLSTEAQSVSAQIGHATVEELVSVQAPLDMPQRELAE